MRDNAGVLHDGQTLQGICVCPRESLNCVVGRTASDVLRAPYSRLPFVSPSWRSLARLRSLAWVELWEWVLRSDIFDSCSIVVRGTRGSPNPP